MTRRSPLRIGYFAQEFPPQVGAGPARAIEMARHWREAGAEVTMIAGMPYRKIPNQPEGRIHRDYRGRLFMEEEWEGHRVLRSWLYTSSKRGFAPTLVNNTSFMVTGTVHALAKRLRLDVLIATSPPFFVHIGGSVLARLGRVPLVLELRDLWPDYLMEMGAVKGRLPQKLLFSTERRLLHRAEHIIAVTDSFRTRLIGKGVTPERIDVIPNGVDLTQYFADDAPPPLPALARENGRRTVGYLGTFGAGQALTTVVEAARLTLERDPDIHFVLAGDGEEKPRVLARAQELGLPNLTIYPPIPKDATRAFYNACDVCLVPLAPVDVFQETIPSKIFEVMACQRPVLASLGGEGARIVEASRGGLVVPPGDPRAMANGILTLLQTPGEDRRRMGEGGREFVARQYCRTALAHRYLEILESVARRRDVFPGPVARIRF